MPRCIKLVCGALFCLCSVGKPIALPVKNVAFSFQETQRSNKKSPLERQVDEKSMAPRAGFEPATR